MTNRITLTLIAFIFLVSTNLTFAQTSEEEKRAALFEQISVLIALIEQLKAQQTTTISYTFTDADKAARGSEGEGVRQLQKALNTLGYTIASTGDGSPGLETTYFGPATETALKRFQAANGIVAFGDPESTGYGAFGPSTRAKLNALLAQKKSSPIATTKPVIDKEESATTDEDDDEEEEEDDSSSSSSGGGGSSSDEEEDNSSSGGGSSSADEEEQEEEEEDVTCTDFTYSSWGSCQPDDTQSRTVTDSSPASCTGGTPTLTQSCTYTPPAPPSGDEPYDLGSVPFDYSWPIEPSTSETINVTAGSIAELQAAVSQSNVRVVVPAGTYTGNLNVTGSDLDVVMSNDATIYGILTWGDYAASVRPARVRWTGGNLEGGMRAQPIDDLLVDDFYVDSDANISPEGINNMSGSSGLQPSGWNRMAWINSTIKLRNGTGGWAWYQSGDGNDLIMANVKMISEGSQNNRFIGITNLIIVDSVFNPDGLSTNGMRIHNSTTNVFMRDSWMQSFFKLDAVNQSDFGPQVLNATFLRVDRYDTSAWGTFAFFGDSPNTGTVNDSTIYSQAEPTTGTPALGTLTGSGNTLQAWDGVTVPNHSNVGAVR